MSLLNRDINPFLFFRKKIPLIFGIKLIEIGSFVTWSFMDLIKLGLYINITIFVAQMLLMLIEWKRFKYLGCWYVTLILVGLNCIFNIVGYNVTHNINFIFSIGIYVLTNMFIWCVLLAILISSIEYPETEEFDLTDEDDFDDDIIEDAINEEGI